MKTKLVAYVFMYHHVYNIYTYQQRAGRAESGRCTATVSVDSVTRPVV